MASAQIRTARICLRQIVSVVMVPLADQTRDLLDDLRKRRLAGYGRSVPS
jgi:hypothetical protein